MEFGQYENPLIRYEVTLWPSVDITKTSLKKLSEELNSLKSCAR